MRKIVIYLSLLLLAACSTGSDVADLEQFVVSTTSKPKGRIPPLPEFKPYSAFTYSASALRSPFKSPVVFEEHSLMNQSLVDAPDENRRKDPLERYSLGELVLVGTLAKDETELKALIKTSVGSVVIAEIGNYLGKNNGKIIKISESKIEISETVPNGSGGWILRPQTLGLAESGGE